MATASQLLRATPALRAAVPPPLLSRAAPALLLNNRGLAKKVAKGKAAAVATPETKMAENTEDVVRGLNIFKDSPEEVKVKPDSEYPDWVFMLHQPRATLEELSTQYERDPQSLPIWDTKRMLKLSTRKKIKELNEASKK